MAVTPTAGAEIGLFLAPLPGQGARLAGGNPGFPFLPFRRLGNAVFLAEAVVRPLLETDGALGDELLVVKPLGQPDIGDGEGQGRVGARLWRQPLAADQAGRVVVIGGDMDDLDP